MPRAIDPKLLASYLNDHLAGATSGLELAKRAASQNQGNRFGEFLEGLAAEIGEDRETLRGLMQSLDIGEDRVKVGAGWVGEKAGRLKLNGRVWGYSPLSRLIELEGLTLGVHGKLGLWESLGTVSDLDPVLHEFDFVSLAERARRQLAGLEREHLAAAKLALTGVEDVGETTAPERS
jgi:hypothetical protein